MIGQQLDKEKKEILEKIQKQKEDSGLDELQSKLPKGGYMGDYAWEYYRGSSGGGYYSRSLDYRLDDLCYYYIPMMIIFQ